MEALPTVIVIPEDGHKSANIFLGITIPLLITSITTLSARILLRYRSGLAFRWEDYLIVAGFLLATVDWVLITVGISWAVNYNTHVVAWSLFQRQIKLAYVAAVPIWGISIALIKISVACLLLRFQQSRLWKYVLYLLIALLIAVSIGSGVFILTSCIPLAANWNPTGYPNAKCISSETIQSVSNFVGGFNIATDVILTLFPLTFLITLRRPFIEKILITILMGLGMLASAASVTKVVYVKKWSAQPHNIYLVDMVCTFTTAEVLIGCTAACLPSLKSPIQKLLALCGIDFEREFRSPEFWGNLYVLRGTGDEVVVEDNVRREESDCEKGSGGSSTEESSCEKGSGGSSTEESNDGKESA